MEHNAHVQDIDEALHDLVARRPFITRGAYYRQADMLLDWRLAFTRPDTGDLIPTREAHDGRPRPATRPNCSPT